MKAFTNTASEETIEFEIDGEKFQALAPRFVSAGVLESYFKSVKAGEIFEAHNNLFAKVLTEESHIRFVDRLISNTNPITLEILGEVSSWLIGDEYMGGGSGNGSSTASEPPSTTGSPVKKRGRSSTVGAA